MPKSFTATAVPVRIPVLLAAAGLALAPAAAWGQGDPLSEPFPAVFEASDFDGTIGFTIVGESTPTGCGWHASSAGDVNGDGFDDIVFSAPFEGGGSDAEPTAYVLYGRPAFPPSVPAGLLTGFAGFRIDGVNNGAGGVPVAGIGDINGDGIDDLAVGDPYNGSGYSFGRVFVVFGREGGLPGVVDLQELRAPHGFRTSSDGWTGWDVSAAGDVNGDGIDDMLFAMSGTLGGGAALVFGRRDGFPDEISPGIDPGTTRMFGDNPFQGRVVSPAGDANGDGIDDILVGNFEDRLTWLVFGREGAWPLAMELSSLTGGDGTRFVGPVPAEFHDPDGSLAAAGDVDGDGIDDILIGSGSTRDAARAYVVYGRRDGFGTQVVLADLDETTGVRIFSDAPDRIASAFVAGDFDINGDGYSDLAIGFSHASPSPGRRSGGETHVLLGTPEGLPAVIEYPGPMGVNSFQVNGRGAGDLSSRRVRALGDVNGDGAPDLLIPAPLEDIGPVGQQGRLYVLFGRRTPCPPDLDGELTIFDFLEFGNLFGLMDPIADFDGDGRLTLFDFLAFQNAFDAGCP